MATPEEIKELRQYRVDAGESSFLTTKSNIAAYIDAVDNGNKKTFYDWCLDNGRADRRRKGSDKESIFQNNREQTIAVIAIGWLLWGMAFYWIFGEMFPVVGCAVLGALVSFALYKIVGRKMKGWTLLVIPILLAVLAHLWQ